ncbi:chromosome partitioning protein ParA [Spongiivirga citrea]|uniref:Chromosome partitioning protein ParA n=1 Tax=Spongiivirga citrea TaxID=1481457 RepID=A0A6M0CFL3_9FLAO|nr:chromosome partitioning protein ParA [Spongiivirga citrea]NER16668.1 chromosome partitioning protein ParA [Spongiivirga citrea]
MEQKTGKTPVKATNTESGNNNGLKAIIGVLGILFLGAAIWGFTLFNEKKEVEATLTEEKQMVITELDDMVAKYDIAINDNNIVNKDLEDARTRISTLIDSVKTMKADVASLRWYRRELSKLKKERDQLFAENDSLRVMTNVLTATVDSTRTRLQEQTQYNDSLLVQNSELAMVVEKGASLKAARLTGTGIKVRSSGKTRDMERASGVDKIKVCFTVPENNIAQAGDRQLYVQVIDPKNNTLGENAQVSFENDLTLNYSLISKFYYDNKNLDVCEFVSGGEDFAKGRYVVNVFDGSKLLTTSSFSLK